MIVHGVYLITNGEYEDLDPICIIDGSESDAARVVRELNSKRVSYQPEFDYEAMNVYPGNVKVEDIV